MYSNVILGGLSNGVDLTDLMPSTKLLVRTAHSLYQLVIGEDAALYVEGGMFFPGSTPANFVGARFGSHSLKVGWVVVGLPMEIVVGNQHIVTSPVHGIIGEPPGTPIVH